jgi:hypothetical protein
MAEKLAGVAWARLLAGRSENDSLPDDEQIILDFLTLKKQHHTHSPSNKI